MSHHLPAFFPANLERGKWDQSGLRILLHLLRHPLLDPLGVIVSEKRKGGVSTAVNLRKGEELARPPKEINHVLLLADKRPWESNRL